MAITKIGNDLLKTAHMGIIAPFSGITGAARAYELSPKERRELREKYGLHDKANLTLRNAGRAIAGGTGGAIAGALGGSLLSKGKSPGAMLVGAGAGMTTGAIKASNKYSKRNV